MSVGGAFTLISNTTELDKILMRMDYLKDRLKTINDNLESDESKTYIPNLIEIEKTHVMFLNSYYKPFVAASSEYRRMALAEGTRAFGSTIGFKLDKFGEFISDGVLHIKLSSLKAVSPQDKVRWCSFVGHKLLKKTTLEVDNLIIDEYDSDILNWHYQFKISPAKKMGWMRDVGQEIPEIGHLTPDPTVDEFREYRYFATGNQTFKQKHDEVDLFIPLIFWFNNPRNAFPSIKLPFGKTFIKFDLAQSEELTSSGNYGGGGKYVDPEIKVCDLYMNNIFISPDMHDIFIKNSGVSIVRLHKKHFRTLNKSSGSELLYNLKFPVETLTCAFRPQSNLTGSQTWNVYNKLQTTMIPCPVVTGTPAAVSITNAIFTRKYPIITNLELTINDISLYKVTPAMFFNSYTTLQGGQTPEDIGWYRFNLNLKPDEEQPSGYFNVSASREMYLKYNAPETNISYSVPVDLMVIAEVLNILIMKDSTAFLKFIS